MIKFWCEGCKNSFYIEDPLEPVHCPDCGHWEGVVNKGTVLPRRFEVTYTWYVTEYCTWRAQDAAKKRGFADYDAASVHTVRQEVLGEDQTTL